MSKRNPSLLLEDILQAVEKIDLYTEGMSQEAFMKDSRTIDAVVRNLEIIGEAASRIPEEFRTRYPDIPWRRIVGLRNRIVHEYFGVDLDIVWSVLTVDLPPLGTQIKQIFDNLR